ncbi:hypothetical protein ZWY2020_024796 [Hordeum vulgare]|nr:hypothetical protein ZWY2020_024796 [Hordeum vulgare]
MPSPPRCPTSPPRQDPSRAPPRPKPRSSWPSCRPRLSALLTSSASPLPVGAPLRSRFVVTSLPNCSSSRRRAPSRPQGPQDRRARRAPCRAPDAPLSSLQDPGLLLPKPLLACWCCSRC